MSETETRIRELLADYERHSGYERTYLTELFAAEDVRIVAAGLVEVLRTGDREIVWPALDFTIQTVIRYVSPEFNDYLPQSGIFAAIQKLLYAPDHNVRHNAVYAIGKMTQRWATPLLIEAFPIYLERYPIELPDLLFELIWLSRRQRRRRWDYYERLAASPNYLVRWSLLEVLDKHDRMHDRRDPAACQVESLLMRLARDERFLVGAEAAHALTLLRLHWEADTMIPSEYRRRKKQIESATPKLVFSSFKMPIIGNHLHAMGKLDYDLPLLDAFARYLQDHPIQPPFDYLAHGREFEAWRANNREHNALL